jgi:hypothetical protein
VWTLLIPKDDVSSEEVGFFRPILPLVTLTVRQYVDRDHSLKDFCYTSLCNITFLVLLPKNEKEGLVLRLNVLD